jgi:hypothetical protein
MITPKWVAGVMGKGAPESEVRTGRSRAIRSATKAAIIAPAIAPAAAKGGSGIAVIRPISQGTARVGSERVGSTCEEGIGGCSSWRATQTPPL